MQQKHGIRGVGKRVEINVHLYRQRSSRINGSYLQKSDFQFKLYPDSAGSVCIGLIRPVDYIRIRIRFFFPDGRIWIRVKSSQIRNPDFNINILQTVLKFKIFLNIARNKKIVCLLGKPQKIGLF